MNIYYTAKDMEDLAAKGVTQLEIGPRVFLTDFAYETAEQLDIKLIKVGDQAQQASPSPRQSAAPSAPQRSASPGRYNKPSGCQHSSLSQPAARSEAVSQSYVAQGREGGGSVNRLVDIMGKIMKRGD
jgi:hypothetical protein